jgi:acyl-CoA reductase-like NAD-dependent aldehyde dehydrogenase
MIARLVLRDPATLERIGAVSIASREAVRRAVTRARKAQPSWAALTIETRAAIIERAAALLRREAEPFARLITCEEGKPLGESRIEVANSAERLEWFAAMAATVLASRREPVPGRDGRTALIGIVEHRPLGLVASICPWNFPLNIPLWSIVPALLCGNAVLFKPSELTPLVGRRLAELLWSAGVPREVLSFLPGSDATGKALVAAGIDAVAFVGGRPAGTVIAAKAAPEMKRLFLELGGKDPAVVLDDADIEKTAAGIVNGAFKNCGQVCCSIERVYVDRRIARSLTEAIVARTRSLVIGHGLIEGVEVGPMIRKAERDRVEGYLADARRKGARILVGGRRPEIALPGWFIEPAVLDRVPGSARLLRDEVFGPVLPIIPVRDEDEAVAKANALRFGLTATVWTRDADRGLAVARRIEAGTVAVNRNTGSIVQHPWGGVKNSGTGRLLGREGLRAFSETVTIRVAG